MPRGDCRSCSGDLPESTPQSSARELPHVDDEQMLLLGLTENLLRAGRSLGLVQLRKLRRMAIELFGKQLSLSFA